MSIRNPSLLSPLTSLFSMDDEYIRERERLIAEDRGRRVDALALAQATDIERRADEIVRRIRTEENKTVWGPDAPPIPGSMHIFPGMGFLTGTWACARGDDCG